MILIMSKFVLVFKKRSRKVLIDLKPTAIGFRFERTTTLVTIIITIIIVIVWIPEACVRY